MRVKEVERIIVVLSPCIVTVYVPAVVAETLIDVVHEPVLGKQSGGEKVMTGPPATTGETTELKVVGTVIEASLFTGSTFTVTVETILEAAPTITSPDVGDAERVKS